MFQPPRCPNRACSNHRFPTPGFFVRKGFYLPRCRPQPVPRFRCRACRLGFSRQTFRSDYRDHRPDLNARLFVLLASGVGLRQSARVLRLSHRCTELKARKIGRHLRRMNLNLRSPLGAGATLQFDEFETFEGRRNTRPLSVPMLIERETRFVIWCESAPIRPRGKRGPARDRAIARDELRFGSRKDLSRRAILRTLARGTALASGLERVVLSSDEKPSYRALVSQAFGAGRVDHVRVSGDLARTTWNPLFPINQTEAMARDLMGRLRRRSWLASKKRRYLDIGLQLWMSYRNYVRKRFNRDAASPAQMLGFVRRRLRPTELLSWRQDWGMSSIHPLSNGASKLEKWAARNPLSG